MRFLLIVFCSLFACIYAVKTIAGVYVSPFIRIQLGMRSIYVKGGSRDDFLGVPHYTSSIQRKYIYRYGVGLYISRYFALEFAYTPLGRYTTDFYIKTIVGDAMGTANRKLSVYDVLAYGYIPMRRWCFYVGAGPTFIKSQYAPVLMGFDGMRVAYDLGGVYHSGFVRPKVVLGVGYHLCNNIVLSVNYSRIFHFGRTLPQDVTRYVPTIDVISIGVTAVFLK